MTFLAAVLLVLGISAYGANGDSYLTPLADFVKSRSNPDVAPQRVPGYPVQVDIIFAPMNVFDTDKEHNTVTTEGITTFKWDTGITWNPDNYQGADVITLPNERFWTPHVQPIDTAVDMHDLSPGLVRLLSNGTAFYTSVYKTTSLCDVYYVQFGVKCTSTSSVWGFSRDVVNVTSISADQSGGVPFFKGCKYQMKDADVKLVDFPFDGKHYQILKYEVTIQEKPGHHRRGPMRVGFAWE